MSYDQVSNFAGFLFPLGLFSFLFDFPELMIAFFFLIFFLGGGGGQFAHWVAKPCILPLGHIPCLASPCITWSILMAFEITQGLRRIGQHR